MGLPKKGSRIINVDGSEYRYIVSGNDGWIDLIVESNETQGQRLIVQFDYEHELIPMANGTRTKQQNAITPETVKKTILFSLQNEWVPNSRGKELRINLCGKKPL